MFDVSIFRSAITNNEGDVDSGYLALFVLMTMVTGAIPLMCIGAFIAMWIGADHKFAVQDLGIGIGAVCGGFATAIGAVGLFRMGDKPVPTTMLIGDRRGVPSTTTTTETTTK